VHQRPGTSPSILSSLLWDEGAGGQEEAVRDAVFREAVVLLEERADEGFTDVTSWVTGSEIAEATSIEKEAVLAALRSLGAGRLHIGTNDVGDDIEVIGVDHDRGGDAEVEA
jgi:hypothetical protein